MRRHLGIVAAGISCSILLGIVWGSVLIRKHPTVEPQVISMMVNLHTEREPTSYILAELERRTSVKLNIEWVKDEVYDAALLQKLRDNTLPQVIYTRNYTSTTYLRESFRQGLFWELQDYLDEYPNLRRLKPELLQHLSEGSKLYGIYAERPWSRQGVVYRKDWAIRLGLSEPNNINDLYVMARAFTTQDPDGNGRQDTVGLAERGNLVYGAFKTVSSYFGTPNGWGIEDGTFVPEFEDPAYLETMNWFRRLYDEGLMNRNFAITTKAEQQELFISGQAGIYIGSMEDASILYQKMKERGDPPVLGLANRIQGPEGLGVWAIPGYGHAILFSKSAIPDEKCLRAVLAFYDQLMEPTISNMLQYGIEGQHYRVERGRAAIFNDRELLDRDVRPYNSLLIGGRNTVSILEPHYPLVISDEAARRVQDNESFLIEDPTVLLESEMFTKLGAELQRKIDAATYKYMMGIYNEEEFQLEVTRWHDMGGGQMIKEFAASYNK